MDIDKPAQKMKDQARLLGYSGYSNHDRIKFSDEEIKRDLLKMKKNNLNEARDLIRKSLGLPKLDLAAEAKTETIVAAPDQASAGGKEEEKGFFGNVGTMRASESKGEAQSEKQKKPELPQNDMDKPDSQIDAKVMTQAKSWFNQYVVIGAVLILIMACVAGYFAIRFYKHS